MKKELELFQKLTEELLNQEITNPAIPPIPVENLWETIDIGLNNEPIDEDRFIEILRKVVLNTPRTATKAFFNQLFGGRNPKATLGDLLAVMLNNSMYTYKVAGPQVGIEKEIIRQVCSIINYPTTSDGTITSGGSMSNMIAMLMARDKADETVRKTGMKHALYGYSSMSSHYSNNKNASFIGVGRDNIRGIESDEKGALIPELLEAAIKEDLRNNRQPFYINATAGTTVLGAFDPIDEISKIAKKYNLWLHVDGAYCGSVIFSKKYKQLVNGLEHADSFNFNAHKMIGTPLTCSILVTKNKKHLHDSLSIDADYLYQTDGDDYNLGKTSLQCGRRNNALKFWTLWKSVGTQGLEHIVDKQFELANVAINYVRNHPDYTFYSFENSISVCFNYKGIPAETICTQLYEHAELVVGFGTFRDNTFIRFVTINPSNSENDILEFFKSLEAFVEKNKTLFEINSLH
ncbi:aminotransferase class V-fold PLP-dependent enzyme [Candidatus Marifrigoribacter sp. Uisw_064]|jgi:sulfinoalanine decarboxylase/sulfinoalanine decarboxylase/aspartate 1-decarboxylase|uniref:pyridoxal phosphate-dependent decarboxylase family protein n=1 Tax=Candidatus Marifrigoribacter sp. Uisw_064 TaxID=3230970 RepID=UPI003D4498B5